MASITLTNVQKAFGRNTPIIRNVHLEVGENQAEPLGRQAIERLLPIGHHLDIILEIGQHRAQTGGN